MLKPTNPKDAVGIRKAYFSVIPWGVIAELGLAMLEGALKYGRHNYRKDGVRASTYIDALVRHVLIQFWDMGEDIDDLSKVHHLTKGIACLTVLRDSIMRGNWTDDRPPPIPSGSMDIFNEQAAWLIDKYPAPKDAILARDVPSDDMSIGEGTTTLDMWKARALRAEAEAESLRDQLTEDGERDGS